MRAEIPFATGTWYHVMSRDITQFHFRSVPKLSQTRDRHGLLMTPELPVASVRFGLG